MKSVEAIRPILLLVDDEPAVLAALEAELRPKFGGLCRIEAFERPEDVVAALGGWASEGRAVALAIVDQRIPGLTGLELIQRLRSPAPGGGTSGGGFAPATAARSVLLTGFGGPGIETAARGENGASLYREKPWSREALESDVDALLGDFWRAAQREPHPAFREFVNASDLSTLWSKLAPLEEGESQDDPDIPEEMWEVLRQSVRAESGGSLPSEDALAAFLMDRASDAQRAEVREAALASPSFRRELVYLMGQVRRLENLEARVAFDAVDVPDWVHRLARGQSPDR